MSKPAKSRKRKLFLGTKVRRVREQHGLTQASLSQQLQISPSYLNQIENDQRPLTIQVLIKLGQLFDIDLTDFSEESDDRLLGELKSCLEDPMFAQAKVALTDLNDIINRTPDFAKHFINLYQSFQQVKNNYTGLAHNVTEDEAVRNIEGPQFPFEEVRDFFYHENNYFHELDAAAEELFEQAQLTIGGDETQLIEYITKRHHLKIKLNVENETLRFFDAQTNTLSLSNLLSQKQRVFQLAHQICLLEQTRAVETILARANFSSQESAAVGRVGLANYFAGALLMPYKVFLKKTEEERYDIERLQVVFNSSFEQICHRLSTLQRPGAKGVPFYFLRVDAAGNISKRQSASSFHFARFGGACPLWNVHEAFAQPRKILRQIAQMPDGKTYFVIARTVSRTEGGYLMPEKKFSVALGCEIKHASKLIYSAGLNLEDKEAAVPIGVSCRVCERNNCPQRAFPPIGKKVLVNENEREFLPYRFL